jgi:hypothetical protein
VWFLRNVFIGNINRDVGELSVFMADIPPGIRKATDDQKVTLIPAQQLAQLSNSWEILTSSLSTFLHLRNLVTDEALLLCRVFNFSSSPKGCQSLRKAKNEGEATNSRYSILELALEERCSDPDYRKPFDILALPTLPTKTERPLLG